jgi:hypothetical protein
MAVRKKGRIVSPAAAASWSTKAAKSIAVMVPLCRKVIRRRPQRGLVAAREI